MVFFLLSPLLLMFGEEEAVKTFSVTQCRETMTPALYHLMHCWSNAAEPAELNEHVCVT